MYGQYQSIAGRMNLNQYPSSQKMASLRLNLTGNGRPLATSISHLFWIKMKSGKSHFSGHIAKAIHI